jgi:hypothetical protein
MRHRPGPRERAEAERAAAEAQRDAAMMRAAAQRALDALRSR